MKKIFPVLLATLNLLAAEKTFSQSAGTLDNSFGANGYAIGNVNTDFFQFGDVQIQPDGKIVVMGRVKNGSDYDIGLLRLNPDGTVDNLFGMNGDVNDIDAAYSDLPTAITLQSDQKILVASGSGAAASVLRFNTDGSRDNTFGTNGRAIITVAGSNFTDAWGVEVQPDQKILIGGNVFFGTAMAARLKTDGTPDSTFGVNGVSIAMPGMTVFCMKLLPDGRIMLGGRTTSFSLVRLKSDGSIDSTFGTNGQVITAISGNLSWVQQIHLLSNSDFIASGSDYTSNLLLIHFTAVKYSADGIIDQSYGLNGIAEDSIPNKFIEVPTAATLQSDGKIVFCGETADAGSFTKYSLLRLNADGSLDVTFGTNGYVVSDIGTSGYAYPTSIAIQPDNKIVAGGRINATSPSYLGAARYHSGVLISTNDIEIAEDVLLFPNPSTDLITLKYSLSRSEAVSVWVTDLTGRTVQHAFENEDENQGSHSIQFHLDARLPSGFYFVSIAVGTGAAVNKIKMIKE